MKNPAIGFSIFITAFALLLLFSCESSDPAPRQLEGAWKLVSAESNVEIKGQKPEKETIDVSEADLIFSFHADGTFSYTSTLSLGEIALEKQAKTSGKFRMEGDQLLLEFYDTEMEKKAEASFTISSLSSGFMTLFSGKEHFVRSMDMMSASLDAFSKALMQTFKDNIIRYDLTYQLQKV